MLEFTARDYVEIAYEFGEAVGTVRRRQVVLIDLSKQFKKLLEDANRLGLWVTRDALAEFLLEVTKSHPGTVSMTGSGDDRIVHFSNMSLDNERTCHHVEAIYATLKAELRSMSLRVIPSSKAPFCDAGWLFDSAIYQRFPNAWKEFQAAGRCYAFGENTACAFHLQRALEWGLKSLAVRLGKRFDRNNWEKHLEDIEKELKVRYSGAVARSSDEKFYSESAAQFGHMKIAWRNPTMHVDAKYDDGEAAYLLTTVERFMDHLAKNNLSEAQP